MSVRKTESRLPSGFIAEDLGQIVKSPNGKAVLISYNSNPIVHQRLQGYVVFVPDNALAGQVDHYDWTIQNGGTSNTSSTQTGYFQYQPASEGDSSVKVELKGAAANTLATLQLDQQVIPANAELEALYAQTEQMVPLAGQPEASREVINDLRAYMDQLAPRNADPSSSLNSFIFSIAYVEVMGFLAEDRNPALEQIASAFDRDNTTVFAEEGANGIGVCRIRPHVLGMYLPHTVGGNDFYIAKKEYPQKEEDSRTLDRELLDELIALTPEKQIDLFNLLRFPKSNLKMAIQLLEGLRAQYFNADNLATIINDKTKAQTLFDQFKRGPYQII